METNGYVFMLRESLEKKVLILDRIIAENERQLDILRDHNSLPEDLEDSMEKKTSMIEEADLLDFGFEEVFNRVKAELSANKDLYKEEIKKMQLLIRQIADRTAQIEAQEERNKDCADNKFSYIKEQIKKVSKSRKAVNSYYNNMMKVNYIDPQFMDNKK